MSCTISAPTVQSVTYSSSGRTRQETVVLTGQVTGDCTSVNVTIIDPASGTTLYSTIDPSATPPGAPISVVNGTWTLSITFTAETLGAALPAICGQLLQFTIACASGGSCQFQQTLNLKCPESSSSSSASSSSSGSSSSGSSSNCPAITLTNLGCNASGGLNIGVTCSNLPAGTLVYQFTYASSAWGNTTYNGQANVLTASFTEGTPDSLPALTGETVTATITLIGTACTYPPLVFSNACGGGSTSSSSSSSSSSAGCSVTVSGIAGVDSNNPPNEIDVYGTAIGCGTVDVIVNNIYVAVGVPVASDGTWNALCQNTPYPAFPCGSQVQVLANCSNATGPCTQGSLITLLSCPGISSSSSSSSSSFSSSGISSSSSGSSGSTPPGSSSSSSSSSGSSGGGGFGGLCLLLLILALLCMAAAIACMIAWACTAFVVAPLLAAWIVLAILGLGLLALWAWLCGGGVSASGCGSLRTILDWLTAFEGVQAILVIALALSGLGATCAIGALIGFGYVGLVISALWGLGRAFKCFGG